MWTLFIAVAKCSILRFTGEFKTFCRKILSSISMSKSFSSRLKIAADNKTQKYFSHMILKIRANAGLQYNKVQFEGTIN